MAPFNPGLSPTNDPNYSSASRGYSKSDVATDTSVGKLFENIGTTASEGIQATDTAIQLGIRKDLETKLGSLFDSMGGNISPEDAVSIAGTGARGARYQAAIDAGLPPPDDLAPGEAAPAGVQKSMGTVAKLQEAYKQGQLSDTRFKALADSIIRDAKMDHPGYTDKIDEMYTDITGKSTANQLRRSVLTDMNSMAAASSSAANKLMTQYHSDNGYIQALHPGMTIQQYAANKDQVDVDVGKIKARELNNKIQEQELTIFDKTDQRAGVLATQAYTNKVNMYIDTFVSSAVNKLREQSEALLAQGADADPKKVAEVQSNYQALRSTIKANLDQYARNPLNGTANSYSTYLKPDQIKGIQDSALGSLDIVAQNLGIDAAHSGVAKSAANILAQRHNQDLLKMEDKFPTVRGIIGIGKDLGPQASSILLQQSGILPDVSKAIVENAWGNIAHAGATNAEPQSVSDALTALGRSPTGKALTVTVQGIKEMAKHPDPNIASAAVHSLYADPKFFANVDTNDKEAIYKSLTGPDMLKAMTALKDSKPESWNEYQSWVTQNALPVYKQAIDVLNQAQSYDRYNVAFDPKTGHFTANTKPEFAPRTLSGSPLPDNAPSYVQKINDLSDRLMPVLKAQYGDQAPQQFISILQRNGYNPDAPKTGGWLQQLGAAAVKGFGLVDDYLNKGNRALSPGESPTNPSMSAPPGKQSAVDINDTVVKVANQYVGLDETVNRGTLSAFMTKAAGRRVDPQTEAWCADFANAVLAEAGGQGTGSAMAKSFLKYGTETNAPKHGDVVVLSRGSRDAPTGHVGFFQGFEEHDGQKYVKVLAGNQGNSVSVAEFPASRVLGYRAIKPGDVKQWKFDTASLESGSTG